jgi:hypothetical protein
MGKVSTAAAAADDDDLPLSEWLQKTGYDVGDYDYKVYAITDDDTCTTEAQTDEDTVTEIKMENLIHKEEEQNKKKRMKRRRRRIRRRRR